MRRAALIAISGALVAAPAGAHARATVDVMAVGKRAVLAGSKPVAMKPRVAKVHGRRCAVGAATPLAALIGTRLPLRISDRGACSRRASDAGSLYVEKIGRDRARGRDGWVYKVGRRAGTTGAGDPSGPFGTGKGLSAGQRVLWFWCVLGRSGSCQRTLEATPDRTSVPAGTPVRVSVRGYDDFGRGVAVEGARVRIGRASARTGADGVATLTPRASGEHAVKAEAAGMVRSFPTKVRVN